MRLRRVEGLGPVRHRVELVLEGRELVAGVDHAVEQHQRQPAAAASHPSALSARPAGGTEALRVGGEARAWDLLRYGVRISGGTALFSQIEDQNSHASFFTS